jgi:malate/lactate dehydrogenase
LFVAAHALHNAQALAAVVNFFAIVITITNPSDRAATLAFERAVLAHARIVLLSTTVDAVGHGQGMTQVLL